MERGDSSGTGLFSLHDNTFDARVMNFIDTDLWTKLPHTVVDPHSSIGTVRKLNLQAK